MNWEHTDIAMAPRAGKVDEWRAEAASYRQSRDVIQKRRSQRAHSLRSRLAASVAALADLITPSKRPTTNLDRAGFGSRASD